MKEAFDSLILTADAARQGVRLGKASVKRNRDAYFKDDTIERDENGVLKPVDKERSRFLLFLDVVTSPSFGIMMFLLGAVLAFMVPGIGPLLATGIIASAAIFAVVEVVSRAREIEKVDKLKYKKAAIDNLMIQDQRLVELLKDIDPALLDDKELLDRLKLGIADQEVIEKHKNKKFSTTKQVGKSVIFSSGGIMNIVINSLALNFYGIGVATAGYILGTTGNVVNDVKHEKNKNGTYNYVAKNAMLHLGISPEMAHNSHFLEDMNVVRARQIAVLEAVKEAAQGKDFSPEQLKELYMEGVKKGDFRGESVQRETKSFVMRAGEVFIKGFDRRYIKNALECSRPDYNAEFHEKVESCIKLENKDAIKTAVKEHMESLNVQNNPEKSAAVGTTTTKSHQNSVAKPQAAVNSR